MISYDLLAIAALAVCQETFAPSTTADASVATRATRVPSVAYPSFEVDIIFPRANVTYNFSDYIPIVFAFQNISAAAALGPFTFTWDIMNYGIVGEHRPFGLWEDVKSISISSGNASLLENSDGSPFILVNSTNTANWEHRPVTYGVDTVYALQWSIYWDSLWNSCREETRMFEKILFNVRPESPRVEAAPDPVDLVNVTGACAQFGAMVEISDTSTDLCSNYRRMSITDANPCAVRLDVAMVSSISTAAANLARPTSTSTSFTNHLPLSTSGCKADKLSTWALLAALGLLESIQFFPF